jgi:hypothetical protein
MPTLSTVRIVGISVESVLDKIEFDDDGELVSVRMLCGARWTTPHLPASRCGMCSKAAPAGCRRKSGNLWRGSMAMLPCRRDWQRSWRHCRRRKKLIGKMTTTGCEGEAWRSR